MFGRKDASENAASQDSSAQGSARNESSARSLTPASAVPARRPLDISHSGVTRREPRPVGGAEERKLTVGRGLSLSGEITACDVLVVEGKVEAKLTDGKLLEITESGQFRGSVEIENADIAGRYDGQLTVHGRLTVRGTGRITGMLKYGELEVNAGGQIIGEMQVVGGGAGMQAMGGSSFKNAAKFTQADDEDDIVDEASTSKAVNS